MKAVRIHGYGGPEVLTYEDVPRPLAWNDEVLVKIHGSGVNPLDWKVRNGEGRELLRHTLPLILGWDFSGVIEAVGSDVTDFKVGEAVYGRPEPTRNGTYAEYTTVRSNCIARKPRSIDHVHAAAVPLAALTAFQALFGTDARDASIDLSREQRILIHGAAGGVGSFAVQLAHWRGANVIATASREHESYVREIGADAVIDHQRDDFANVVKDVDAVLDLVGGDLPRRSLRTLRPGGVLASTLEGLSDEEASAFGVRAVRVATKSSPSQLAAIGSLIDDGVLKVPVSQIFSLEEAAKAHAASEGGHARGKIVLRVAA
ncbi:MAG: NADP-dependent oxidoreductase [Polyangiaceae bacterium]